MQITELLKLTKWYKDFVIAEEIPKKYNQLFSMMNRNSQPNQQKQSFESQREQLFKSLRIVNLNKLTLEQIKFLERLQITELLGEEGIRNIERILFENNLDIATAAKKVGQFNAKITNANQVITELDTTLSRSFSIKSEDEIPTDSVMMRIYFQEESAINNISDFKKLANTWFDIGRGIAMAQDKSPEDFRIIGAHKGSVIIELAVIAGIATSVSTILLAGLKVAERVIEILKKAEELKKLKLNNKKIEQEIIKEADSEKKNGINTILEAAIIELGLTRGQDGDKITSLEKSITKLIDFTQKGGAVDFVQPNGEDNDDDNIREEILQLKNNVQDIRKLENKIKMIESKLN